MNIADEIQKLDNLRASGALTEAEYNKAKARVLDGPPPAPVGSGAPLEDANPLKRFTRSSYDAWLGGVCGGLANITPIPSWAWRLGFCLAVFAYGFGILPYILLWIFVPLDTDPA